MPYSVLKKPLLVGDIGGTNARFAIMEEGEALTRIEVLACADYPGLVEAVEAYLSKIDCEYPGAAAIAVATPLSGDVVRMTNNIWSFSIEESRNRLGLDSLLLLNDFTALAMSLPQLKHEALIRIGGGEPIEGRPLALIGPGTGLGVSALIPTTDGWFPLQTEGGHVTFAPANEREVAILQQLWLNYDHVSAERLLSGPGLVLLYQTIAALEKKAVEALTPPQVSQKGIRQECEICTDAVERFCCMLGTVAGNLALTLGAQGGVYIGGGIVPQLGDYFASSGFRQAFEHRGRFSEYLAAIPTYVITAPWAALEGAAQAFFSQQQGVGIMKHKTT